MSDAHDKEPEAEETEAPLYGLLAEYEEPGELIEAAKKVRDAGFKNWDTFSPFPVHGIDPAMGIKPTVLPWLVLGAGLTGLTTAILLQWWTNAYDYPWIVSGKPIWSIPANVPVMFELTVLFSALTSLGGMLALNGLPHPSHPLDLKERFARVTDDRFFLLIQASDPKFDEEDTRELLKGTHPTFLDDVLEDRVTSAKMPRALVYGLIIAAVASVVPFALFAAAREAKSRQPRIHAIADMDFQRKFKAQRENTIFADQRSMRDPLPGTVAVGDLRDDDHFYVGKQNGAWARVFPAQVPATAETMERGQQRFQIFCAPCHGLGGEGNGMVHQRAAALNQGTWIQPSNINQDYIRDQPVGEIFNTITHGIRNMPAYGPQIDPEDRWAIVMYVRALQRSHKSKLSDVPDSERGSLQ